MPTIKILIEKVKYALNHKLLKLVRISGLTVDEYIEKEASRRSLHWREEKDEFAIALQKMHQQNSANLNKVRELQAQISGIPNKKQIFDEYLKQEVAAGHIVLGPNSVNLSDHAMDANSWTLDVLSGIDEGVLNNANS